MVAQRSSLWAPKEVQDLIGAYQEAKSCLGLPFYRSAEPAVVVSFTTSYDCLRYEFYKVSELKTTKATLLMFFGLRRGLWSYFCKKITLFHEMFICHKLMHTWERQLRDIQLIKLSILNVDSTTIG